MLVLFLLVGWTLVSSTSSLVHPIDLPPTLTQCYQDFASKTNASDTVGEAIHSTCLQRFLWKPDGVRWGGFNMTEKQVNYINSVINSLVYRYDSSIRTGGRRHKRQMQMMRAFVMVPPSGYRIRKEYRRLLPMERNAFHAVVRMMFSRGEYQAFALLHQGIVEFSAHDGPNFLSWHRCYLALFEEAMRRYDRSVSIPYWDTTIDFPMENPADSIVWTDNFLGNGDGIVTTGPFANWMTPVGPLTRNVGAVSQLISKEAVARVLTRCRTSEIIKPAAMTTFDLEFMHGGPHRWVSGMMQGLDTAAHDPVFFLFHAFVDYVWEMFRMRQRTVCGIDPTMDYPQVFGLQDPNRVMDGFPIIRNYLNVDGYQNFWTQFWYGYEASPVCSPECGSPFMRCEEAVCVSVGRLEIGEVPVEMFGVAAEQSRMEADSVIRGSLFEAPPSDGRTQQDVMRMQMRFGRSVAPPKPLHTHVNALTTPIQNTFFLDGKTDIDGWAFIPVQVIAQRSPETYFPAHPISKGKTLTSQDVFNPVQYNNLESHFKHGQSKGYEKCTFDPSGAGQIFVQSDGLNYMGTYSDYAIVDARLPMSSAMSYIGVKRPGNDSHSDVIIAAFDNCGRMCQPSCHVSGSKPPVYQPCAGALRIDSAHPRMYGMTYGDAVLDTWQWTGDDPRNVIDNIQIVFRCSQSEYLPWLSRTLSRTATRKKEYQNTII